MLDMESGKMTMLNMIKSQTPKSLRTSINKKNIALIEKAFLTYFAIVIVLCVLVLVK